MLNTKISWCDHTWNPFIGCCPVSAGCENCYAKAWATRWGRSFEPHLSRTMNMPLQKKVKDGDKVFVCSLSDFFVRADGVDTDGWRRSAIAVMQKRPGVTFLVLTKRADEMRAFLLNHALPANVWLGVTIEDQDALWRAGPLLQAEVPSGVRFVSVEPMVGPIEFPAGLLGPRAINWVIVGGESGAGARRMENEWVQNLSEQCRRVRVPMFFKQWGAKNDTQQEYRRVWPHERTNL